ncbi:MAG TPA: hypothetical protein VEG63_10625 [Candidatus Acidoferrales bacterium]|nr:hypothetical protein [Candidatus Acidoferrales bacterium]
MILNLVPAGTRVTANGDGERFDISSSNTRTFLCTLEITAQIEQESIDVSIQVSDDGENWGAKPFLMLPQQFYRGRTRLLLDLTLRPQARHIRAHWEVSRWGRVAPTPMFEFSFTLEEVPASLPLAARS